MKKVLLGILTVLCCMSVFAKPKEKYNLDYDCPNIDFQNYYLIDLRNYPNSKINSIEILFYGNNQNSYKIYGNNPGNKNWEELAKASVRGFSDKVKASFTNKDSINWRYFLITPENEIIYRYKLTASANKTRLEIRPENDDFDKEPLPKINLKDALVFEISKYGAEDYVVFLNHTQNSKMQIIPYYYDRKSYKWVRAFEIASLKGFGDTEKIEITDDDGIEDIKYLAFEIDPFKPYSIRLYENHSDLYIDIEDENAPSNHSNINDINDI